MTVLLPNYVNPSEWDEVAGPCKYKGYTCDRFTVVHLTRDNKVLIKTPKGYRVVSKSTAYAPFKSTKEERAARKEAKVKAREEKVAALEAAKAEKEHQRFVSRMFRTLHKVADKASKPVIDKARRYTDRLTKATKEYLGATKGHWTVVNVTLEGAQQNKPKIWVRCKCGHRRAKPYTPGTWDKVGKWSSCGCLMEAVKTDPELAKEFSEASGGTYHGMSNTSLFRSWRKMRVRCNNEKEQAYRFYGAKGIRVCKEWDHSGGFIAFMNWALAHGWEEGMEINRIDHTGDYTPDNCNWMTKHDNLMEMHSRVDHTKYITIRDITLPQATWLKLSGITPDAFSKRKLRGLNEVQALALPKSSRAVPTEAHVDALVNKATLLLS